LSRGERQKALACQWPVAGVHARWNHRDRSIVVSIDLGPHDWNIRPIVMHRVVWEPKPVQNNSRCLERGRWEALFARSRFSQLRILAYPF